jgi:hypothetical protein
MLPGRNAEGMTMDTAILGEATWSEIRAATEPGGGQVVFFSGRGQALRGVVRADGERRDQRLSVTAAAGVIEP